MLKLPKKRNKKIIFWKLIRNVLPFVLFRKMRKNPTLKDTNFL